MLGKPPSDVWYNEPVNRVLQMPKSAVDRPVVTLQRLLEGPQYGVPRSCLGPFLHGSDRLGKTGKPFPSVAPVSHTN